MDDSTSILTSMAGAWLAVAMLLVIVAPPPASASEQLAMPLPTTFFDQADNLATYEAVAAIPATLRSPEGEIARWRLVDEVEGETYVFDFAVSEDVVIYESYAIARAFEDRLAIRVTEVPGGYRWDWDNDGASLGAVPLLTYESDIQLAGPEDDLPFCDGMCGFAALGVGATVGGAGRSGCATLATGVPVAGPIVGVPCLLGATAVGGEAREASDLLCDRQVCGEPILSADPKVKVQCQGSKPDRYCRAITTITRESEYDNYVSDLDTSVTWIRRKADGTSADIVYRYDDSQMTTQTTFESYGGTYYYRATLWTPYSRPSATLQRCSYSIHGETDVQYLGGPDGYGSDAELYANDALLGPPSCP